MRAQSVFRLVQIRFEDRLLQRLSAETTYVVLPKENHMKLIEATTLDRKSGGAERLSELSSRFVRGGPRSATHLRRKQSMGAPGLAFETWDPCNQFPLETPTLLFVIRSEAEGPAFSTQNPMPSLAATLPLSSTLSLSSRAQPRDLQFRGFSWKHGTLVLQQNCHLDRRSHGPAAHPR